MFRNSKINSKIFNFNHSNLKERPKSVSVSYLDNIDNAKITDDKYNSTFIQEQNVFSETERTKLNMLSNLMNDLKSKNKPRIINEMNKIFLCLSNSEDSKTYLKDKIQQVDEKCEVILKENQEIKSFIKAQSKELSILIKEMKCLKLDVNKSCINQSNPSQSKVNLSKNKNLSTATFNSPLKKVEQPIKLLQKKEVNDASLLGI